MNVRKIHWLGVGLSSPPGILYLIGKGYDLEVWNRTTEKAARLLSNKIPIQKFNIENLKKKLQPNDLIVSMLPASKHLEIANIAVNHRCHLLSSSYYDPLYEKFNNNFVENKTLFMCEAGLDPGIDHLLAHKIINDFKISIKNKNITSINFKSMCGGFPLIPNEFRYKFSWSPLGVLKALKSKAQYIKNFKEKTTLKPYDSISNINFIDENFEIYPNRDSLPYIKEYKLNSHQSLIESFQRGTIRLNGWSIAWKDIFKMIDENDNMEQLSLRLWDNNQYKSDEKDRVLLYVSLIVRDDNKDIFNKTLYIDESREVTNSSMSQCVSYTVASTIERICNTEPIFGVHRIFQDVENVSYILKNLQDLGISIKEL